MNFRRIAKDLLLGVGLEIIKIGQNQHSMCQEDHYWLQCDQISNYIRSWNHAGEPRSMSRTGWCRYVYPDDRFLSISVYIYIRALYIYCIPVYMVCFFLLLLHLSNMKFISARVATCVRAHSGQLYSAVPLENKTVSTITWCLTQCIYPEMDSILS